MYILEIRQQSLLISVSCESLDRLLWSSATFPILSLTPQVNIFEVYLQFLPGEFSPRLVEILYKQIKTD